MWVNQKQTQEKIRHKYQLARAYDASRSWANTMRDYHNWSFIRALEMFAYKPKVDI